MKEQIAQLLETALQTLKAQGVVPSDITPNIQIENTRDKAHGDFATNLALMLAKTAKTNPRALAQQLCDALPVSSSIDKTEIAGPGFINFFVNDAAIYSVIGDVLAAGETFGLKSANSSEKVQVEFVSANPTGPLHVGHGRGAAYGATVADLLEAVGFDVHREYYVNDAGRQMDILASSVWLRYLELCGEELPFPVNGYKGDYVWDVAAAMHRENGEGLLHSWEDV